VELSSTNINTINSKINMLSLKYYRIIGTVAVLLFLVSLFLPFPFFQSFQDTISNKIHTGEPGYGGFDNRPWVLVIIGLIFNPPLIYISITAIIAATYLFVPERKLNKLTNSSLILFIVTLLAVIAAIILALIAGLLFGVQVMGFGLGIIVYYGTSLYTWPAAISLILMIIGLFKKN